MTHCEFCTSQHQAEFWRGRYFYAIDAGSNDFPGFIRIVAVDHVAEMSALSPAVRTYLWDLLETTEETMRDSLAPDKMNLAEFGNMVPHLHWHVIARWKDDGWYPECPWGTKQREVNAEIIKMRRKSAEAILPKLATALAAISEPQ